MLRVLLVGLCVLVPVLPAWASGEAAATVWSRYYRLRLSTGVRVMPAEEPDEPGNPCPRVGYFEREERELLARLAPTIPAVNELVEAARKRLPIVALEPALPGPPYLRAAAPRPGLDLESWEVAEAKAWLRQGRVALTSGRTRSERGLQVTLSVAVDRKVDGAALDALASQIARLVAKVKDPLSEPEPQDAKGCGLGPVIAATVIDSTPTEVVRPGLRIRISAAASAIDAAQGAWWQKQVEAYAAHLESLFVAELRGRADLPLPPEWPNVPPRGAVALDGANLAPARRDFALYVTYAGLEPHVGFVVPWPNKPAETLGTEIFKKLYDQVGPPDTRQDL